MPCGRCAPRRRSAVQGSGVLGQTGLDFDSCLGIFSFQDRGQVRLPVCFILGFLIYEKGIQEPANFPVGELGATV